MTQATLSLTEFYDALFRRYADRTAVTFRDDELTYAELDDRTGRLANAFRSMGVKRGDSVAVMMANRPASLVTEIAAVRAGATIVPLNSELGEDAALSIIEDADARTLVLGPSFFSVGRALQQDASVDLDYVIGIADGTEFPIGFHRFDDLVSRAEPGAPTTAPSPDDVAAIYYTGGTTGDPKGAMHTHRGLILNAYSHVAELEIGKRERALLTTPLGHSAGYIARALLAQGGTIVLERAFDPDTFVETIAAEHITWSFLIPTMLSELLDSPRLADADTDSLDTLVYGASSIPASILEHGVETLGRVFIQLYGLTEVPNLVSVLSKPDHDPDHEGALQSAGYPVQLADVTIADADDRWDGDIGEIVVTSPYAMKGYRHQGDLLDDREEIRTGDLGRFGDDGRLYVLGRIQDVIVSDGQLVFPSEVENVVQRHDAVHQVAIIGIPKNKDALDPVTADRLSVDQVVKAVVVAESDVSLEAIREFCRAEGLDDHQLPRTMDTVGALPETPYGKIDKQSLRQPYW